MTIASNLNPILFNHYIHISLDKSLIYNLMNEKTLYNKCSIHQLIIYDDQ